MLIILILVTILQGTCISNHHVVHFKHIQLYLSTIPQKNFFNVKREIEGPFFGTVGERQKVIEELFQNEEMSSVAVAMLYWQEAQPLHNPQSCFLPP